jgi:hypothetical protein
MKKERPSAFHFHRHVNLTRFTWPEWGRTTRNGSRRKGAVLNVTYGREGDVKQTLWKLIERWVRITITAVFVCASLGHPGGLRAKPHGAKKQPVIRVRIYNYAYVYRLDLRDAERHAAYLFAKAGIRITWTVYWQKHRAHRIQPEDSGADFYVRIVPASMAAAYSHTPGALGQSLVPSGVYEPTPGGTANVFYARVKHICSLWGLFPGEVLGDAIAHELGHLLLGSGHSPGGLMRAHWTLSDLRLANQGQLRFSPGQVVLLQRAAWSLHQDSSSTLAAKR